MEANARLKYECEEIINKNKQHDNDTQFLLSTYEKNNMLKNDEIYSLKQRLTLLLQKTGLNDSIDGQEDNTVFDNMNDRMNISGDDIYIHDNNNHHHNNHNHGGATTSNTINNTNKSIEYELNTTINKLMNDLSTLRTQYAQATADVNTLKTSVHTRDNEIYRLIGVLNTNKHTNMDNNNMNSKYDDPVIMASHQRIINQLQEQVSKIYTIDIYIYIYIYIYDGI